jgi:CRISPR-associated protein Cas2
MRTILFFDLPTITSKNKKDYRHFVKKLINLGFYRLQESVFVKMSIDNAASENAVNNVKTIIPPNGNIFCITITEKQFAEMKVLLGESVSDVLSSIERYVEL